MPLYDYECTACGTVFETMMPADDHGLIDCSSCGAMESARRIVSLGRGNSMPEDPGWLQSVLEVVDKKGGPHCQEFLKHPTRANWKNWMKKEGLRELDPGENTDGPREKSVKEIAAEVTPAWKEATRKRNAIELKGADK